MTSTVERPENDSITEEAFLVFAGGNGAKVFESVIHMAGLGMWSQQKIHALLIDTDTSNGNLSRAEQSCGHYNALHEIANTTHGFFHTEIIVYPWKPVNDKDMAVKLKDIVHDTDVNNAETASILSQALFSDEERSHLIDHGFHGHPTLGVLFIHRILRDETLPREELDEFLEKYRAAKGKNRDVKMMLVASCYGGTGAASISAVGQYLREKLDDLLLGGLILLPTFDLKKTDNKETMQIQSHEFNSKVKTVLHAYSNDKIDFWRKNGKSLYRQLYFIGAPNRVGYNSYDSGSKSQENPSLYFEWHATGAIAQFFNAPTDCPEEAFVTWVAPERWDWQRLPSNSVFGDGIYLNIQMTKLLQAMLVYCDSLHHRATTRKYKAITVTKAIYRNMRQSERIQPTKLMEAFISYMYAFLQWCFDIASYLPAGMAVEDVKVNAKHHGVKETELEDLLKPGQTKKKRTEEEKKQIQSVMRQRYWDAVTLCRLYQAALRLKKDQKSNKQIEGLTALLLDLSNDKKNQSLGVLVSSVTDYAIDFPIKSIDILGSMCKCMDTHAIEAAGREITQEQAYPCLINSLLSAVHSLHDERQVRGGDKNENE